MQSLPSAFVCPPELLLSDLGALSPQRTTSGFLNIDRQSDGIF